MDLANPYIIVNIPIFQLIASLAIGLLCAVIWSYVISRTTRLIVDTRQYLPMFLLLIPSMILIITIIKTSIALSLGLVGALSIVRFRTPIKEPEELLYIFVAIAVGLGLGSGQILATITGFSVIVLAMIPFNYFQPKKMVSSNFIDITLQKNDGEDIGIENIKTRLEELEINYQVKRIHESGGNIEILIAVNDLEMEIFDRLSANVRAVNRQAQLTLTENSRVIT